MRSVDLLALLWKLFPPSYGTMPASVLHSPSVFWLLTINHVRIETLGTFIRATAGLIPSQETDFFKCECHADHFNCKILYMETSSVRTS